MKITILKTLILSLLITTFFSCNDNDDNPTPDNGNYFLKVKIDGVDFSTSNAIASAIVDASVVGLDNNGNGIQIIFANPATEGTFTSMNEEVTISYQETSPVALWGAIDNVGTGTVTITENNATYIKGTFSFTGFNVIDSSEKVFTEGSFKAKKI